MSTGDGASTGTAARGGGSKGERVPRTGWRFVRHLNRLSALAFLRPVRKVSLGAEFPTPFREPILRPGLPTPLPRAGRAEPYRRGRVALRVPDSKRSERARFSARFSLAASAQLGVGVPELVHTADHADSQAEPRFRTPQVAPSNHGDESLQVQGLRRSASAVSGPCGRRRPNLVVAQRAQTRSQAPGSGVWGSRSGGSSRQEASQKASS
jgi:hypothetical protein